MGDKSFPFTFLYLLFVSNCAIAPFVPIQYITTENASICDLN